MSRRSLLLLLTSLLAAPTAAWADDRVPLIPDAALPVAGTCAAREVGDVTEVRVGSPEDLRWFAVSGVPEPVEYPRLVELLQQRAGGASPSPHTVWVRASGEHAWAHAAVVRQACFRAGLYRVGLLVRSEATGQVMGFPLFLPPGPSGRPGPRAGELKLRITAQDKRTAKAASDVGHVYAAARRAQEKRASFGVERIVGNLSLATNAPLQYAVTAIDLLFRGGCSGVKLSGGIRLPRRVGELVPIIEIQGGVVSRLPQALRPPPLAPRAQPWPLDGACEPGWVDFDLVDLPAIDAEAAPAAAERAQPQPNYAEGGRGVPPDVMQRADAQVRTWARALGTDVLRGLRGGPEAERRFAVGLRRKEVLEPLLEASRRAFPDATRIVPSALQFNAFLFDGGRLRGRADVTLNLAAAQLGIVFGRWVRLDPTAPVTLVPFPVDPFAAGDPAGFRVWLEGVFDAARRQGAAGLPLAAADDVLRALPAVAHAGTRTALGQRGADLERLAAELARTPYDRVVLVAQRGTATVVAGNTVVGVLNFGLRPEEQELRLDDLTPRRAP